MANISETFRVGLTHHQSGDLSRAAECYHDVLRRDSHHADALHLLGVLALQQGRYDDAVQQIGKAIDEKPRSVEYHGNLASAYRASGRLDEAVDCCRQALEIDAHNAILHNNMGNVLSEQGKFGEARDSFQRAVDLDPKLLAARDNLNRISQAACAVDTSGHRQPASPLNAIPASPPTGDSYSVNRTETELKTVLHVGCGYRNSESLHERYRNPRYKEIRLDIDPNVEPDIVASLTDMHPVESETVDALWSSHNIEHLYAHEVPIALAEFHRVLKPGGMAFITLPDLQQISEFVAADKLDEVAYVSPAGPITVLDCIFGFGKAISAGNEFMSHKTGFTATSLEHRLRAARFSEVRVWSTPITLWAEAIKG